MKKFLLLILLPLFLIFIVGSFVQAADQPYPTIITDYPDLPACENNAECHPGQAGFGLPQFVKYIFIFAIGGVGVVGFIAIIFAAFSLITSAGNPQKAADSKDKIVSALLGILLLLGSVILLNLINPDLLKFKINIFGG